MLKASKKDTEGYQMNTIRAQYPVVYGVLVDALKRIRKLEIKVDKQQKAIKALESQVQPLYAEEKRKQHAKHRRTDHE